MGTAWRRRARTAALKAACLWIFGGTACPVLPDASPSLGSASWIGWKAPSKLRGKKRRSLAMEHAVAVCTNDGKIRQRVEVAWARIQLAEGRQMMRVDASPS